MSHPIHVFFALLEVACRTIPVTYCYLEAGRLAVTHHVNMRQQTSVWPRVAVRRKRLVYRALVNEPGKLHGYRQLEGGCTLQKSGCRTIDEAEWQIGHRWRSSGHYDDRLGAETRRRAPERRWLVRTPKRPVQSDGTGRHDVAVPYNGVPEQPVRRHCRWAVGVATGPIRRQPIGTDSDEEALRAAVAAPLLVIISLFMFVALLC